MLYVKGICLNTRVREQNYVDKKDGVHKSFTAHRSCLHNPEGEFDPIYVETGEVALVKGKAYRVPIRVSTYKDREGNTKIQYQSIKNYPPQELREKAAGA
jgi:hypothetical protein